MKLIACTVGAVLMLAAASPSTSEPTKPPRVEIGRGAFLRGPIVLRDDAGKTLLSLGDGQILGRLGPETGCSDAPLVQYGGKIDAAERRPFGEGDARTHHGAADLDWHERRPGTVRVM